MLCTRYLRGMSIDATPDPPSLSFSFARGRAKVQAWGGVLTAIISHFGRQFIGNNMNFTPCSMHILLISNKCNKFWMSCGCRRLYTKNQEKWAKTQAGWPAWHLN